MRAGTATEQTTTWHGRPANEAVAALATRMSGLTDEEAAEPLEKHGANRLPAPPKRSPILRFLAHFHNVLIYVLIDSEDLSIEPG
jgi:magnesium-transporting ATPase (P-type)